MTAADLNEYAADKAAETSRFELLTNQAQTSGQIFDHMAPLPVMPDHRNHRSWEPAARHYRDLDDEERERIG
jgi:hypothetical protein